MPDRRSKIVQPKGQPMATLLLRDLMRADPITIESQQTIQDAANIMSRHAVRHLIVVAPTGKPVGVLSQRDIFRHLSGGDNSLRRSRIGDVMSAPLKWGHPTMPVSNAAQRFVDERIGCLAVIEADRLIGIVTRGDLLSSASWYKRTVEDRAGDHIRIRNREPASILRLDSNGPLNFTIPASEKAEPSKSDSQK